MAETFADAARAAGGVTARSISIAGHTIRLDFAGEALVPRMMPALAHLEGHGAPAELTVSLFDSATTHTPLPPLPFRNSSEADEGWLYSDETHHILRDPFLKTLTLLDRARDRIFLDGKRR